jgi:hypothetical protein
MIAEQLDTRLLLDAISGEEDSMRIGIRWRELLPALERRGVSLQGGFPGTGANAQRVEELLQEIVGGGLASHTASPSGRGGDIYHITERGQDYLRGRLATPTLGPRLRLSPLAA